MESSPSSAETASSSSSNGHSTQRLDYIATGGSLLMLNLKHALLTIVTLGIYSFWARNNIRVYHYAHTELGGEPFTYHGTGRELLIGSIKASMIIFVIAFVVVLVPSLLLDGMSPQTQALIPLAIYPIIAVLAVLAINSVRRYRFSRSSWRGIRFSYHGEFGPFMAMMLKGFALTVVTLGFYSPWFANERRAYLVNHARYGSEPFVYEGDGRAMFGEFIKAVLLTIPTLGLYWIWYGAAQQRYMWSHTRIAGARFVSTVTGSGLLVLAFTNVLLVAFTFGIGAPWAIVRMHKYAADNLMLRGAPEWATIQQRAQAAGAMGEGIAEGLDMDVGIGL